MIRHYLFPVVGIILGFSACRSSETNEKQVLMVKTETVKNYENELQVTYPGRVKAAADVDLAFRVAGRSSGFRCRWVVLCVKEK